MIISLYAFRVLSSYPGLFWLRILTQNNIEESQEGPIHKRTVNVNCVDPLGRSAILMAIDNENYEMLKLLIDSNVDVKDALLYAVSEEFVEAVELLLNIDGDPYVSSNLLKKLVGQFPCRLLTWRLTWRLYTAYEAEIIQILLLGLINIKYGDIF